MSVTGWRNLGLAPSLRFAFFDGAVGAPYVPEFAHRCLAMNHLVFNALHNVWRGGGANLVPDWNDLRGDFCFADDLNVGGVVLKI